MISCTKGKGKARALQFLKYSVPGIVPVKEEERTNKGRVQYGLLENNTYFNIDPFSGDIYTISKVPIGKYVLQVVAKNSINQNSTATVTVLIQDKKDSYTFTRSRRRRELSDPVEIRVKENTKEEFAKRIPLFTGEHILAAPIVRDHFTIHSDGTVSITKPLNYEKIRELSEIFEIAGRSKSTFFLEFSIRTPGIDFTLAIDFTFGIGNVRCGFPLMSYG
ncbi:unnamed protein product [Cylicostephanus goldi]|uniref:Cadherin domain-containing protein n=1 Tax=Cylicostephanus goldi TaxID=71465 RepID=A0A3P7PHQ3_CYLGO|nr:unnamed protein product [Cylicostephanus goldi]